MRGKGLKRECEDFAGCEKIMVVEGGRSELSDLFFSHCYTLGRTTAVLTPMRGIYLCTVPIV